MRHFNIAYTGAYNRRHKRVGHLYQGRYKAILVDKDSYLSELSRYVHVNPVRIGTQKMKSPDQQLRLLEKYRWSSLAGYLASRHKQAWVIYHEVLGQFGGSRSKYRQFVAEAIQQGYATPWKDLKAQVVLGSAEFFTKVKARVSHTGSRREQPAMRAFEAIDAEDVVNRVSRYLKVKAQELTKKRTPHRDYRSIAMELMYRYSKISQEEIGERFGGLDYSAVSRERKRLRERMQVDRSLRESAHAIEAMLTTKLKV